MPSYFAASAHHPGHREANSHISATPIVLKGSSKSSTAHTASNRFILSSQTAALFATAAIEFFVVNGDVVAVRLKADDTYILAWACKEFKNAQLSIITGLMVYEALCFIEDEILPEGNYEVIDPASLICPPKDKA